ncbi:MAG: DUF4358 domain-containing protein [Oscillibacter sp.]|jgi:DNA mismatch repair ATPase MutL|nr:DUF4358 domain-containing protein [Oscillibacter sp.]
MKKRWIALLLALAMTAALSACGSATSADASGSSVQSSAESSSSASSSAASSTEEEGAVSSGTSSEEESTEPETQPEQTPTQTEKPSTQTEKPSTQTTKPNTTKPSTSKPDTTKPSGGSSSATQPESGKTVDLSAFYTTLSSDPNFPSMSAVSGDALDSLYAGLNDLKPKQCLVYMPMISAVASEVALVECASSADVQTVKTIFQARIDYQIEQGAFYPATVEAWQNSAKIVSNGNFVMLVCGDSADTTVSAFNALFK